MTWRLIQKNLFSVRHGCRTRRGSLILNYLDLFHGIGGFALGAYWAGMKFENHYCSDIEPYAQELYKLRFPGSIQLGDITKIKTEDLPNGEWIITGGFPCQDISIAGHGKGITGERSGLWFDYARIIGNLRPQFAIMENVGELIRRGMEQVLGSLAEVGYDAEWGNISASNVGACHKRERYWIIAYPAGKRWDSVVKKIEDGCSKINTKVFDEVQGYISSLDLDVEPDFSIASNNVKRNDDGLSEGMDRFKGLGNAIVPQIAELLFNRIKYLLDSEPRKASQS